jgi:hypothetical protein
MNKFQKIKTVIALLFFSFCFVSEVGAQNKSSESIAPSILVLGGANHTQAGFPNPDVERAFIATAANAAENLADVLTESQIKNSKLIVWSRYPEYKEEVGLNSAMCDCNFWMQVSFGKNVNATPQTAFYEYELLSLTPTKNISQQGKNTMREVRTVRKFKRRFEVPFTSLEVMEKQTYEPFAKTVVAEIVKSGVLKTFKGVSP